MELDFYPFGIQCLLVVLLNQGVLVGIKQQVSLNKNLEISHFHIDIKTHLFVHLLIKQFLIMNQHCRALSFSKAYEHLGYFNHALEMMLHVALEEDGSKSKDSTGMKR